MPDTISEHEEPWSRRATAAEDQTWNRYCQRRTGSWGCDSHRVTRSWTRKNWKNIAWSDESWFQLQRSDHRVRIWRKLHENTDPSWLTSMVQATGGVVGISQHTLGVLLLTDHGLNTAAFLGISASATSSRITFKAPITSSWTTVWCLMKTQGSSEGKRGSNPGPGRCT